MRGAFRHAISQRKRWTSSGNSQINCCCFESAKCGKVVPWILRRMFDDDDEVQEKSWRGSKGWRQASMTRGYRSRFQDLINVWTMPAIMFKNKVMYSQLIHGVAFVNWKCCTCLRPSYLYYPNTPRTYSLHKPILKQIHFLWQKICCAFCTLHSPKCCGLNKSPYWKNLLKYREF